MERTPRLRSRSDYARRFEDVDFWRGYVAEVLRRHGLGEHEVGRGVGGTFPTFLAGPYVVKFFGRRFQGAECFVIERSLHTTTLVDTPFVPRYVADGHLFESGWRWPYLITTRLQGSSCFEAKPDRMAASSVARQLGTALRTIHELDPPTERVWSRDLVAELHASCAARMKRRRMLPSHLLEQLEDYLAPLSSERSLVHADLHSDHVFVDGARLVGIIDWGDALYGDPYYELPSLFFGTFRGDKSLLEEFLTAYGWPNDPDFVHHAMTMTLVHEFNPLGNMDPIGDDVRALDRLAQRLWRL